MSEYTKGFLHCLFLIAFFLVVIGGGCVISFYTRQARAQVHYDYVRIAQLSQVSLYYDMVCYPHQYEDSNTKEIVRWVVEEFTIKTKDIPNLSVRCWVDNIRCLAGVAVQYK